MNNNPSRPRTVDFHAIGERLRAYRMGASLRAEEVAAQLGVSRAAVYRMEKGEIIKIETLERLAHILDTTLASLLGVGAEYYTSPVAYIERMRQLETDATRIMAHFEPISFLLTSDQYAGYLEQMLREAHPDLDPARTEALMKILGERKRAFARRRPPIISLIGLREIERFVHFGLVGRIDLPPAIRMERSLAARREVERIIELLRAHPMDMQIGIVDDSMPNATFQVFERPSASFVAISPFRFGELPNVATGIAHVTSAPEAVQLYTKMVEDLWQRAYKGQQAAELLSSMLKVV
ncbi:MAG: helix-turn-helix transcriptional regulator [Pigmentiphaga sp.]|uniref:helix-turn-helix domain-containing protein n=1 Tax=Pigmentiphaga sp. TaxID=1977564 RepID=UPI0029BAE421|nr:helix-turn-helix transcriptional regulator [Pigmentiphaga sp.]MDX3905985.1 helix-turn-helix transcriptional regulator [Pigmentiphaga sp.]